MELQISYRICTKVRKAVSRHKRKRYRWQTLAVKYSAREDTRCVARMECIQRAVNIILLWE